MKSRNMTKSRNALVVWLLFFAGLITESDSVIAQPARALPSQARLAWQNAELGVVFHYDLHVFDGKEYSQTSNRISPVPNYNIFDPTELNTDQLIRSTKAVGAKFALLTVTHALLLKSPQMERRQRGHCS